MRLEDCGLLFEICERREEQQHTVKRLSVDALIREIGALATKGTLDVEAVDDKAAEATGAASEC
jgi:hypothetical protein